MSRRSERLVKKRKQTHSEYIEDLSKFGKKRKVEKSHLLDVTNDVKTLESGSKMPSSHVAASFPQQKGTVSSKPLVFNLPTRLALCSNPQRRNPLPSFDWACSSEVWKAMLNKEVNPLLRRDPNLFERHCGLDERMRSILLDWLIEVCEVYKMHRETFYLGADYIDRYLSRTSGVRKSQLQLVGITALFIAAKMEEIYPARLSDFSYVTDGACTEEDILQQEIVMLKHNTSLDAIPFREPGLEVYLFSYALSLVTSKITVSYKLPQVLEWNLSPVTAHLWLTTFYQAACVTTMPDVMASHVRTMVDTPKSPSTADSGLPESNSSWHRNFLKIDRQNMLDTVVDNNENAVDSWSPCRPSCDIHRRQNKNGCSECFVQTAQYTQHDFIQIVRLLDLSILDSGWLRFPYSVLAASVFHYHLSTEVALRISGYQWSDIADCVEWMSPYARVLECNGHVELKTFSRIVQEDSHNIQTHTVSLELLDHALASSQHTMPSVYAVNLTAVDTHLKLPVAVHPASSPAVLVPVTMVTPPNSQNRRFKQPHPTEEDSGCSLD